MQILGQIFAAIATVGLFTSSGAGLADRRLSEEQSQGFGRLLAWAWRAGALIAIGALLLSALTRGLSTGTDPSSASWPLLASTGDRAAAMALVAALLSAGARWRDLVRPGRRPTGWAGLALVAIVASIAGFSWPVEEPSAPILILCTLLVASVGMWATGEALNELAKDPGAYRCAPQVSLSGVAIAILIVGAVNWRTWGTPAGVAAGSTAIGSRPQGAFLGLLAVWLIGAGVLALGQRAGRFVWPLNLLATALLVGIALSVQWTIPFS